MSCATGGLEPGLKSPQQASDKVASFCTRILQIRDFALRILWSLGTELLLLSRVSKTSLRHTNFGPYQVPSALFCRYGMLLRADWRLASRCCSINDISSLHTVDILAHSTCLFLLHTTTTRNYTLLIVGNVSIFCLILFLLKLNLLSARIFNFLS